MSAAVMVFSIFLTFDRVPSRSIVLYPFPNPLFISVPPSVCTLRSFISFFISLLTIQPIPLSFITQYILIAVQCLRCLVHG